MGNPNYYEKILYLLVLLWITASGADAQAAKKFTPLPEGSPGSAGVSEECLARIERLFEKAVEDGDLWGEDPVRHPGLAFGVVTQKGEDRGGQGSAGSL